MIPMAMTTPKAHDEKRSSLAPQEEARRGGGVPMNFTNLVKLRFPFLLLSCIAIYSISTAIPLSPLDIKSGQKGHLEVPVFSTHQISKTHHNP
jgi:hypothetical protein